MSVLAVIPCLNEASHIGALVDQMLRDDAIDALVVVDGGSTDGTQDIVQRRAASDPRLTLLHNPARIQSAAVNLAVARYGGPYDWLLRIDAHCLYPDGYASRLLRAAAAHSADSVVVPMITRGETGFQRAVAAAQNSVLGTGGSPHRHVDEGTFVDHGHHALMRIDRFRKAGGYCEAMPCNEDAELDHRLTKAGARIWLEPGAAITYFPRRTPAALWKQYFGYGIGRARTVKRHALPLKPRQLLPLAVPAAILLLPLALLHWIFAVPAMTWAGACLAGGIILARRSGGGATYLSGIAAGIMHAAWGFGFLRERLSPGKPPAARYGLLAEEP